MVPVHRTSSQCVVSSYEVSFKSYVALLRYGPDKIWLPTDRPTDRHSDSYIPPQNFVFWGYNNQSGNWAFTKFLDRVYLHNIMYLVKDVIN